MDDSKEKELRAAVKSYQNSAFFSCQGDAYKAGFRAGAEWKERSGWISVEERLPEKSDEYLVIQEGYATVIPADFFDDDDKSWRTIRGYGIDSESRELFTVTHWRPLPAAPVSEGEPER